MLPVAGNSSGGSGSSLWRICGHDDLFLVAITPSMPQIWLHINLMLNFWFHGHRR
jgi:hypothetical protein